MKNPTVASWFLQKRVYLFFEHFFLKDFSMIDYWYQFEWQNRENVHVHGFLWLQDGYDVGHIATNNDEKRRIIEYFDRLICTESLDASCQSNLMNTLVHVICRLKRTQMLTITIMLHQWIGSRGTQNVKDAFAYTKPQNEWHVVLDSHLKISRLLKKNIRIVICIGSLGVEMIHWCVLTTEKFLRCEEQTLIVSCLICAVYDKLYYLICSKSIINLKNLHNYFTRDC